MTILTSQNHKHQKLKKKAGYYTKPKTSLNKFGTQEKYGLRKSRKSIPITYFRYHDRCIFNANYSFVNFFSVYTYMV